MLNLHRIIMLVICAYVGTQEITETSEEIRLNLVTFLTSIVSQCAADISPYLSDLIIILQNTIVDPYPEVKKVSFPKVASCCNPGIASCTLLVIS